MTEVKLYGIPISSYTWSARLALAEKGIEYDMIEQQPHSPEQLALHPFGKVPALRNGDLKIFETVAIMRYVDEAFDGPQLQPPEPEARAQMEQWLSLINDNFYDAMIRRLVLERFAPIIAQREPDEEKITEALPDIEFQLNLLDTHFATNKHLASDDVTLADMLLIPIIFSVAMTPEGGNFLVQRPHLARWQKGMASRSSFVDTMPPFAVAASIQDKAGMAN